MSTVAALLAAARQRLPANEARLLLGHVLQQSAVWLITHDDAVVGETAVQHFASLVARRDGGEPVAYLLGQREFFGREFEVATGVLIPRPETELLVDVAGGEIRAKVGADGTAYVLDLGTGSGCIAITLALEHPQAQVTAVDVSEAALVIARRNASRLAATVEFVHSHWFAALPLGMRFDLIVSNPPYIASDDAHLSQGDLRFEPATALASGPDGLDAIRHIISQAPAHLHPGGSLWLEHGYDQADAVATLLHSRGFIEICHHQDLAGLRRVCGASWRGQP